MKLFIFSSLADRPFAHKSREIIEFFGHAAVVVMDAKDVAVPESGEIVTSFNRRKRLRGQDCAIGIAETLRDNADSHSVVGKLDADTRLFGSAISWLASAEDKPHGFSLQRMSWWGCYAYNVSVLPVLIEKLKTQYPCSNCPEDTITGKALRATVGTECASENAIHVFQSDKPLPESCFALTLPSYQPVALRASELEALFSIDLPSVFP